MKALIFAAGRGQRMRPLTDYTAKPLLEVGGKPLIVWQLERLASSGIREVVINTAHLAGQFPAALGDGTRWGLRIRYSHEGNEALETGGGMLHALPLLGDAAFLAVNGDIWSDFDFASLPDAPAGMAHLLLVDNPRHHPQGDFILDASGKLHKPEALSVRKMGMDEGPGSRPSTALTFAGIGLYRPELLTDWQAVLGHADGADAQAPHFPLAPLLYAAAMRGQLSGQQHTGQWTDVGTAERLRELEQQLQAG